MVKRASKKEWLLVVDDAKEKKKAKAAIGILPNLRIVTVAEMRKRPLQQRSKENVR